MGEKHNRTGFEDGFWWSNDGLRLHYRDYQGRSDRPPILCFPGLTRNARDFEGVAQRLAGEWRVIVVELRGRGESAYAKDPISYVPLTYLQDVEALISHLAIDRFIAFGTSLGGILTMLLGAAEADHLVGALLNDIGPELNPEGLARIRGYVGKSASFATWVHAARATADANRDVYPDYDIEDWLRMAKRLYRLTPTGRITLDYDMKIAEPFRMPGNEAGPDMWRAFDRLKPRPLLVVRGERSDIFPAGVAEKMIERCDDAELVTIANTGHAPTLEEDAAAAGIDRLLARVELKLAKGAE